MKWNLKINKKHLIGLSFVILMAILTVKALKGWSNPEVITKLQQPEFLLEDSPDTVLYKALVHYEVLFPEIVFAQAILETGNFRSYNSTVHNNLFGLYNSRKGQYFRFSHWTESIVAYKKYIQYRYREGEDYYKFLKRIGYAEDPQYEVKVKAIVTRYDQRRNSAKSTKSG